MQFQPLVVFNLTCRSTSHALKSNVLYGGLLTLEFDVDAHVYRGNGIEYPSVTTILKGGMEWVDGKGKPIPEFVIKRAGWIGSQVHAWIEDHQLAQLEFRPNPPIPDHDKIKMGIHGYLAWLEDLRKQHSSIVWVEQEVMVASMEHHYAGTVDALLKLDDRLVLIDFKTSNELKPEYDMQVSAYHHALVEMGQYEPIEARLVRLDKKRGTWEQRVRSTADLSKDWSSFKEKVHEYEA